MAEADWTFLTDDPGIGVIDRGVTNGIARPNGGGNFVFGFNSLVATPGTVGQFTNQTNFAPTPALKGGSIRGAIQRGISAGAVNFSPFLFIGLQGDAASDLGYLIGLTDGDPYRIALRKGAANGGIPDVAVGTSGILARSTATFQGQTGDYHHVRLDMIVNQNGDVILQAFENDLDTNPVTAPVWTAIAGMAEFKDDNLGVNSGSQPFTSGRMGYGFQSADISRRGFFDHIEAARQT